MRHHPFNVRRRSARCAAAACAVILAWQVEPLFAHAPAVGVAGLASGALHPLTGVDHLLAMVAVGIWGTQLGAPLNWALPVTFPIVMAVGAVAGIAGWTVPGIEPAVAGSALFLGSAIALAWKAPRALAVGVVAVFALCHGYAHGAEIPSAAEPLAYGLGFVVMTGLLHLCGIALGLTARWPIGRSLLRVAGAGIAATGAVLLVRVL